MARHYTTDIQYINSPYARRGLWVRLLYLFASLVFWILSGFGTFLARRAIVLCYHGITADQAKCFEEQVIRLRPITNTAKIRKPVVWLTFDDAFCNLLKYALPMLDEFQIHAIVFAVSGNLGEKPRWAIAANHPEAGEVTMTAEQLQTLSKHPLIRVGSHTQTHPDLSRLLPEKVRQELTESKRTLEHLLSGPVEDLALPHGAFNDTVLQIAREVGYKRIYTLQPKLMSEGQLQEGVIGRFSMSPDVWPIEFYLTCSGAYAWLLPWRSFIRGVRRLLQRV